MFLRALSSLRKAQTLTRGTAGTEIRDSCTTWPKRVRDIYVIMSHRKEDEKGRNEAEEEQRVTKKKKIFSWKRKRGFVLKIEFLGKRPNLTLSSFCKKVIELRWSFSS